MHLAPRRAPDDLVTLVHHIEPLLMLLGHPLSGEAANALPSSPLMANPKLMRNACAAAGVVSARQRFVKTTRTAWQVADLWHLSSMLDPSPKPLAVMPAVLLLDDNEAYRNLITEVLTFAGFDVCAISDGRSVPAILQERRIDLVITDIVMPERDGLETLTDLRYSHPRLPVIAISGDMPLNTDLYLTIAKKLGAARVLAKPFRMDALLAAVREVLAIASPVAN